MSNEQSAFTSFFSNQTQPNSYESTRSASKAQGTQTLDADTKPQKKSFNVTRFFYHSNPLQHPEPSNYRLELYDALELNPRACAADAAFQIKNSSSELQLGLREPLIKATKKLTVPTSKLGNETQYLGKVPLKLSHEWQPLPSLCAEERMTHYYLNEAPDIEIQYSLRDNLYYIRQKPGTSQTAQTVEFQFLLSIPKPAKSSELPKDIQDKIKECQAFQAKALILAKPNPSGADYLDALKTQKVGACRHRSFVLKAWMEEHHPEYKTRIVNNECHSFIEIEHNNRWISCNLGGYPAELKIHEPYSPEKSTAKEPKPEKSAGTEPKKAQLNAKGALVDKHSPAKYFNLTQRADDKVWETRLYMQHLLHIEANKKLIRCQGSEESSGFRYHLQHYCQHTSRPCFYIHAPKDLILKKAVEMC